MDADGVAADVLVAEGVFEDVDDVVDDAFTDLGGGGVAAPSCKSAQTAAIKRALTMTMVINHEDSALLERNPALLC